jgi:hypothetical protein
MDALDESLLRMELKGWTERQVDGVRARLDRQSDRLDKVTAEKNGQDLVAARSRRTVMTEAIIALLCGVAVGALVTVQLLKVQVLESRIETLEKACLHEE